MFVMSQDMTSCVGSSVKIVIIHFQYAKIPALPEFVSPLNVISKQPEKVPDSTICSSKIPALPDFFEK